MGAVIVSEPVRAYLDSLRPSPDPLLAEMEEHAHRDRIPVVVPETGQLLEVLARTRGSRRALEIGTAIGVSTLYIARGQGDGGRQISFEIDPERHGAARAYLDRAGLGDRVDLRLQDAREGLAELAGDFDFLFLDGVKLEYDDYLSLALPLLAPGATVVIDNVLQEGAVAGDEDSAHLRAMRELNRRVMSDPDLIATITPVGDGVLVATLPAEADPR